MKEIKRILFITIILSSTLIILNKVSNDFKKRELPDEHLVISYCSWGEADDKIIEAVDNGSNVIIWFAMNLLTKDSQPFVDIGVDLSLVKKYVKLIKEKHPEKKVTHLISIGGWNAPHFSTDFTSNQWFDALHKWNTEVVAQPSEGFDGFDGFDYDIEGNDDYLSKFSHFTVKELNLMGELAVLLKKNGYLVTMAPAQSYFDVDENNFDLDVNHTPSWRDKDSFPYAGKNVYAYLWSKYNKIGKLNISNNNNSHIHFANIFLDETNETFDFVSLQIYEGWSRANYVISNNLESLEDYFYNLVNRMVVGWEVKFSQVKELDYKDSIVSVPLNKLVIGLANGWANERGEKFLLLWEEELEVIFNSLSKRKLIPRGFMFWCLASEGVERKNPKGEMISYYLVKYLRALYNKYS